MDKDSWIWMPHAGHFICSDRCCFKLNTYVNGYIVSTVGEFVPDYHKDKAYEEIGSGRLYETMVFKAKESEHPCCPYTADISDQLDFGAYNKAGDAYLGHLQLCEKWSNK